ncbi:MAG: PepSY domain-containing protein [Methylococcaceae bacterium]|jgi:uncharacterized membrane protein YkoI|nr:PepSY domain-containing protein [Methylococcaceae bacterium]MDZ4158108.1 PepSY domain-containing protein [Methylococcales bacterium]MDP2392899.1 PepSY domain-containing protein [Methylococcaceae bacterium]MDP3020427.1 PepSY domain-containing protein [Methylococcaceae bacterium]MDP3390912.1 PepSY domain-containing protein [Methylococcaceae bacterium]
MKNLINAFALFLMINNNSFAQNATLLLSYVSLDDATKQIIEGTYDKVLGAQTELIDGKQVHVIKVLTPDGRIRYYRIDAETGQLVNETHS